MLKCTHFKANINWTLQENLANFMLHYSFHFMRVVIATLEQLFCHVKQVYIYFQCQSLLLTSVFHERILTLAE